MISWEMRFIRLFLGVGHSKALTLWGVLCVVQGQASLLQVFVVSIAVGSSLQRSDRVVDAFQRAGRDRVVVPVEQTPAVLAEGLGHDLHLADPRGVRAAAPGFQEPFRRLRALIPELPQVLLQIVRDRQGLIPLQRLLELGLLIDLLILLQVLRST